MPEKLRVLFVCVHNGARSQMAEALLRLHGGPRFEVQSAGLEPGSLNPLAVEAMRETGIDISGALTKSVASILSRGETFDYIVTVCDESQSEKCPVFPGGCKKLHWGFADPAAFTGTWDERLRQTRLVRNQIEETIKRWVNSL